MTDRKLRIAMPTASLALAWTVVLGSVLLSPWIVGGSLRLWLLPWIASLVVFGLPHGAFDPLVPFRLVRRPVRAGPLALFCLAYLALAVAVVLAWMWFPVSAAVAFVALTWFHWGQGDLYTVRAYGWDPHLPTRAALALASGVRGALPMLVPLVFQPDGFEDVLRAVVSVVSPSRGAAVAVLLPGLRVGAAAVLLLLLAAYGVLVLRAADLRHSSARFDVAEIVGLALFFAVLPPLWSVGMYFCFWHSVRHLSRLGPLVAQGSALRFGALALPATVGALALFWGLAGVLLPAQAPLAPLAVYLVGISALTVPHVALVTWMDVRQGVWSAAR